MHGGMPRARARAMAARSPQARAVRAVTTGFTLFVNRNVRSSLPWANGRKRGSAAANAATNKEAAAKE